MVRDVLLIGDGFAEGFGDRFAIGSVAGLGNRIEELAAKEEKLRMRWQFINAGKYGTTSEDWLPSDPHSQYHKVFNSPKYQHVEVVLIMLGSCDSL